MAIQTTIGAVEGFSENGVSKYLGIPFAEAPVGERRFQKPVPKVPWEGCLEAKAYGSKCPQLQIPVSPPNDIPQSEDCLYLNVWASEKEGDKKPVLVWIYGGALSAGEGSADIYDGSEFARNGDMVVVTFNYRVGVFGGFYNLAYYPGMNGKYQSNAGLYDVLEGLRWVHDNIAAFGGDPDNVTICGESAGASIVGLLLCSEDAEQYYQKAILESTFNYQFTPESDRTVSDRLLQAAGLGDDAAAALLSRTTDELLKAVSDSCGGNVLASGASMIEDTWMKGILSQFMEERALQKPVLIGMNHDEGLIFQATDEITRHLFLAPVMAVAQKDGRMVPTYLYRYDFSAAGSLGAIHSAEMPCVFHNLHCPGAGMVQGDLDNAEKVSQFMHKCWISFCRNGDPGWKAWTGQEKAYMRFDVISEEASGELF